MAISLHLIINLNDKDEYTIRIDEMKVTGFLYVIFIFCLITPWEIITFCFITYCLIEITQFK